MKSLCLTLLGGAALGSVLALAGAATGAEAAPSARPAARSERSCKPQAPVALELIERAAEAGLVSLDLSLRPLRDLDELSWRLVLPDGASLVEGSLDGQAASGRGAETRHTAVVSLPVDSRYRRVVLEATGRFLGSDQHGVTGPETVVATAVLSWGVPEPDAPLRLTVDPVSGQREPAVVLPSRVVEARDR